MTRILFVGDIMPGGILPYQENYITDEVKAVLSQYDLRVGTLETAVGESLPFEETKMRHRKNVIHCRPKDLQRIKELNFDLVSLANNHAMDMGAIGLCSTIKELDKIGIGYLGAGKNIQEASKPAVVEIGGLKIAFLAYCQCSLEYMGYVPAATETSAGVNPLEIERCEEEISRAKKQYDYVFVLPHWGKEYEHFPLPEIVNYSKRMIKAGADGIFGSHTHSIQPLVSFRGKPIAFSMGNFLFPDFYMEPPRPLWYPPEDVDTSDFDRFDYYPGYIERPCVQVWRPISRKGVVVECSIDSDGNISSEKLLLSLSPENILGVESNPNTMKRRMSWMGKVTMMWGFPVLRRAYYSKKNLVRRGYHYLCSKL